MFFLIVVSFITPFFLWAFWPLIVCTISPKKILRKINPLKSLGNNSEILFKDVPKPTSILADMVAARVLQCRPEDVNVAVEFTPST